MPTEAFTDRMDRLAAAGDPGAQAVIDHLQTIDLGDWVVDHAYVDVNPDAGTRDTGDITARDRSFLAGIWRSDGAHWQHKIHEWLQGNTTRIVHTRLDANGSVVDTAELPPPTNMKGEGLDVAPSGDQLVFTGRFHEISNDPTRLNLIAFQVRAGVWHPYSPGTEPEGAYVPRELITGSPAPPPAPEPSGPSLAEIAAMTQGQFDHLVSLFGGPSLREGIEEKVADAGVWLLTAPDNDPRIGVARAYRDALFAFHRNLVGAQLWEFAIRARLVLPTLAPQWVHELEGYPWGVS